MMTNNNDSIEFDGSYQPISSSFSSLTTKNSNPENGWDYYTDHSFMMNNTKNEPNYLNNEKETLIKIHEYIKETYGAHYSTGKSQLYEHLSIFEKFFSSTKDIKKYITRYGKKDGYNKKDLLKIIHLSILLYHWQDEFEKSWESKNANK